MSLKEKIKYFIILSCSQFLLGLVIGTQPDPLIVKLLSSLFFGALSAFVLLPLTMPFIKKSNAKVIEYLLRKKQ